MGDRAIAACSSPWRGILFTLPVVQQRIYLTVGTAAGHERWGRQLKSPPSGRPRSSHISSHVVSIVTTARSTSTKRPGGCLRNLTSAEKPPRQTLVWCSGRPPQPDRRLSHSGPAYLAVRAPTPSRGLRCRVAWDTLLGGRRRGFLNRATRIPPRDPSLSKPLAWAAHCATASYHSGVSFSPPGIGKPLVRIRQLRTRGNIETS